MIIEDIFPSILAMAGVAAAEQIGGIIDGVSFVPLLEGDAPAEPERSLVWHFPHCYDQPPYSALRQGGWKLIYWHTDQRYALYNIREDIGESNDRQKAEPEITQRMARTLGALLRERGACMPIVKATENRWRIQVDGNSTR